MISSMILPDILEALRQEIFTTPLESIGTLFGVANIILLVRRNIWNYPAGIVSVALLAYVFFHTQLFSDTLLQFFFIVVQLVGWAAWLRHREPDGEVILARSTPRDLTTHMQRSRSRTRPSPQRASSPSFCSQRAGWKTGSGGSVPTSFPSPSIT